MLRDLQDDDFIVSKTNKKGHITYVNKIFIEMSEYNESELLGKPHSIIRHKDMPKAIFKYLWNTIEKKEECFAYVLNHTKNGNAYWVFANITASLDTNGNIIGYYSVRRKPNPQALDIIIPLYKEMLKIEKSSGIDASFKVITDILEEKGVSYDEFIIDIQQ